MQESKMKRPDLDAIEKRCEAATPRPWVRGYDFDDDCVEGGCLKANVAEELQTVRSECARLESAIMRYVGEAGMGDFPNNADLTDKLAQVFQVLIMDYGTAPKLAARISTLEGQLKAARDVLEACKANYQRSDDPYQYESALVGKIDAVLAPLSSTQPGATTLQDTTPGVIR